MKNFKISDDLTVKLCESIEDLNIKRWTMLKALMVQIDAGMSVPSIRELMVKWRTQFDNESPSGMLIALHDYIMGIEKVEHDEDPDQLAFALITLMPNEDVTSTDTSMLKDKLELYSKAGITQGIVKKEVENFIKGLPLN